MKVTSDSAKGAFGHQAAPYSLMAKIFHWAFIVVFAYGLVRPVDELEELEDGAFLLEEVVFAIVFLMILLARFIYMRTTRPNELSGNEPGFVQRLARLVHLGLYLCPALLALSGLVIGGMYASAIKSGTPLELLLWIHEACMWASINLIALHVVVAIRHRCLRDGVWSSMVPFLVERAGRPPDQ